MFGHGVRERERESNCLLGLENGVLRLIVNSRVWCFDLSFLGFKGF